MSIPRTTLSSLKNQPGGIAGLDIAGMVTADIHDGNVRGSGGVNIFRYIPPSEWGAIQDRTSNYDCHDALMSAINHDSHGSGLYMGGSSVIVPHGKYNFSQTIAPKKRFNILGMMTGQEESNSVEFKFSAGVTGVVIERYNTFNGGVEITPSGAADGSLIQGIKLTGGGYDVGPITAHGIVLRARAKLIGVTVAKFHGDGFRVVAAAGVGDPVAEGNANLFRMELCSAFWVRDNGLYVDGPDANAGSVVAFNAVDCGRWGIWDSSFLGNGYEYCHTAENGLRSQVSHNGSRWYVADDVAGGSTEPGTNPAVWVFVSTGGAQFVYPPWVPGGQYVTGGAYKCDAPTAANTFISCYSEGDQPPSSLMFPAIVIGGLHGAGFTPQSTALIVNGSNLSRFRMRQFGAAFETRHGFNGNEAVAVVADGDHSSGLALAAWNAASGDWLTQHAKLDARVAARYTTDLSTFTGGRPSAVGGGHVRFPRGAFMGQRMVDSGTAPPTTGAAGRGDMRINESAAAGQPSYWQCTTAGVNGAGAVWTAGPLL